MNKIILLTTIFMSYIMASNISLKPGQSKIFYTDQEITTVFASDPKVFDYQIIAPNKIVVYSKSDGYGEIKVFSNNKTIIDLRANIDSESDNLVKITKVIEKRYPGANVKLEKISAINNSQKGYIISGNVPNEEVRENAYLTAATALGLSIKIDNTRKQNAVVTSQQGVSLSSALGGGSENLNFLAKNRVDGLVDAMIVDAPKQVNVKLVVADVEKGIVEKLGIDFNQGKFVLPILTGASIASGGSTSLLTNIKNFNITSFIDAIKDDRIAKVLATPNISVLSGESASFQVTSQYTPFSTTVTNNGDPVSSPQTPIDFGVSLTVQPRVYSKDRIVLNVSQEVSNIQSTVETNGASAANLKKRRTQSVIELADGDSFVLSGLVDERDIEQVNSVPLLGDIPFLGAAFRKSGITRTKTELIVIATVTLVSPTKEEFFDVPNFRTRSILSSLFNFPHIEDTLELKKEVLNFTQNVGFVK